MQARAPELWYYRITHNQEMELERAIGQCKGVSYQKIIARIDDVKHAFIDKPRLKRIVLEAAEKAGCTGQLPLVDGAIIEHLRAERARGRVIAG